MGSIITGVWWWYMTYCSSNFYYFFPRDPQENVFLSLSLVCTCLTRWALEATSSSVPVPTRPDIHCTRKTISAKTQTLATSKYKPSRTGQPAIKTLRTVFAGKEEYGEREIFGIGGRRWCSFGLSLHLLSPKAPSNSKVTHSLAHFFSSFFLFFSSACLVLNVCMLWLLCLQKRCSAAMHWECYCWL